MLRSGHLQTLVSVRMTARADLPTVRHAIELPDGDTLVLHEDRPDHWRPGRASVLLVHGLCGCHAASYMVRLADRFYRAGTRVFRLDLRGCGAGAAWSKELNHAGRSDDLMTALGWIARETGSGPLGVAAISLGGNQLLRGLGRVGTGEDPEPPWFDRLQRTMAVAPPIDLMRCSLNLHRLMLRPYNRYFVRVLLARVPIRVRQREDFPAVIGAARPRTLMELDERITAPLSGFRDAADYYQQSAAAAVLGANPTPTLILAAADDPIVPVGCFTDRAGELPPSTKLLIMPRGGHVGFIARGRQYWMDDVAMEWFAPLVGAPVPDTFPHPGTTLRPPHRCPIPQHTLPNPPAPLS